MRPWFPLLLTLTLASAGGCADTAADSAPAEESPAASSSPLDTGPPSPPLTVRAPEWTGSEAGQDVVRDVAVGPHSIVSTGRAAGRPTIVSWDRAAGRVAWRLTHAVPVGHGIDVLLSSQVELGDTAGAAVAVPFSAGDGRARGIAGLSPDTGKVSWTWRADLPSPVAEVRMVGVAGDALIVNVGDLGDEGCPVGDDPGPLSVAAVDLHTGKAIWTRDGVCVDQVLDGTPVTAASASADGFGGASALDPRTGRSVWNASPDAQVCGIADGVVLWRDTGLRVGLTDIRNPGKPLPAFPHRSGQPTYAEPQQGLLLVAGTDSVYTYAPGDDAVAAAPGIPADFRGQSMTIENRIVVQEGNSVVSYGRDGVDLHPPVRGTLVAAGPDFLEVDRAGRLVVLPVSEDGATTRE